MDQHIIFVEASVTGAGELAHRFSREQGLRVTLLSRNPDAYEPAILAHADDVRRCDTNDIAELVRVVREIHAACPVHGITTTADFFVPQAARAAQEIGLPGLEYECALAARNKHRTRLAIQAACPEHNPRFALVDDAEAALAVARGWGMPLVAKPLDDNDGSNVLLIRAEDELTRYMIEAQRWTVNSAGQRHARGVLLEEYVDGLEFSIETLQCKGGPLQLIGVTAKELAGLERSHFVEVGHSFPVVAPVVDALFAATGSALRAIGVDCGVIHTECRVRGGEVKVMEVNPRLAGGKIGSHLVEIATGRSPVRAVIDIALGREVTWRPERSGGAALRKLWSDRRGTFGGLENQAELEALEGVVDVVTLVPIGAEVRPPENNGDTLVAIVTRGASQPEARALAVRAAERARLRISAA